MRKKKNFYWNDIFVILFLAAIAAGSYMEGEKREAREATNHAQVVRH